MSVHKYSLPLPLGDSLDIVIFTKILSKEDQGESESTYSSEVRRIWSQLHTACRNTNAHSNRNCLFLRLISNLFPNSNYRRDVFLSKTNEHLGKNKFEKNDALTLEQLCYQFCFLKLVSPIHLNKVFIDEQSLHDILFGITANRELKGLLEKRVVFWAPDSYKFFGLLDTLNNCNESKPLEREILINAIKALPYGWESLEINGWA